MMGRDCAMTRLAVVELEGGAGLPVEQFLTYRLHALHAALNRQASEILGRVSGLRLPEWRVMALLGTGATLNATKIGQISAIDKGLLSRTLDALEQRGLIRTERDLRDRRSLKVALTAKGHAVYDKTIPHMQARQRALMKALNKSEQIAVFPIIDKLLEAVSASK
jgi:DNA-binding MarR family transcriptional regulator